MTLEKKKPWWQSKTIATIGLTALGVIITKPPVNKQEWVQAGLLVGGGLLASLFRKTSTEKL